MAKVLKPEQLKAIFYLAQPNKGGKTMEQIAKECGVTVQTIYNWKNNDAFEAERVKQMLRNVLDDVPDVQKAMVNAAIKEGNAAAAKLIFQQAGMLTDKVEVETKTQNPSDLATIQAKIDMYKSRSNGGSDV
ncbi:MAG TPA: phBC6A51 family helix-turn-helix protein [Bacillota bacterium]|nr:phBC6A51 family helix-turn-helix protein [Bacillota bacterium]